MMLNGSQLKMGLSKTFGLTRARWLKRPCGLYVFTFHRIGNAQQSPFDPNVFSCRDNEFVNVIDFIKSEFNVIGLSDLKTLVEGDYPAERSALITFDDGYLDNFLVAAPVLEHAGVTATFFVATSMADGELPWWDQIAFWAQCSSATRLRVNDEILDLTGSKSARVRSILKAFKEEHGDLNEKLATYKQLLKPSQETPEDRLIMNWSELRQLVAGGFTIGSHTITHPILSHLDDERQLEELSLSKYTLEEKLGCNVNAVAYPVGGQSAYTETTTRLAEQSGYDFAFTSISGINDWENLNHFAIRRIAVDSGSIDQLKYRVSKL